MGKYTESNNTHLHEPLVLLAGGDVAVNRRIEINKHLREVGKMRREEGLEGKER